MVWNASNGPPSAWEGPQALLLDVTREVDELISLVYRINPFGSKEQAQKQEHDDKCCQHHRTTRQKLRGLVLDGADTWKSKILLGSSLLQYGGVVGSLGNFMSPNGPGCCDHNGRERVANLLTSLPYAAIGIGSMRRRQTAAGKVWGGSMVGVAAGSLAFHASSGKWRQWGRRLDYWAIALSSCMLSRAVYPGMPPVLTQLGLAATPFKPFLVSAANTMAMEIKFLQRALQEPGLRHPQRVHSAAALGSLALFALEDHVPQIPFVHASWHCLSALGCNSVNALFKDAEDREAAAVARARQQLLGEGRQQWLAEEAGCGSWGGGGGSGAFQDPASMGPMLLLEPLKL